MFQNRLRIWLGMFVTCATLLSVAIMSAGKPFEWRSFARFGDAAVSSRGARIDVSSESDGRNEAIITPKVVNVGQVEIDERKEFAFLVKNNSPETITIATPVASCSCTNVKLNGSEILTPGAERSVTGAIRFGGHIGTYETKVVIPYKSAGGHVGANTITISGKLVAAMVLEKSAIDLGDVGMNTLEQSITIEAKHGNSGQDWDSIQPIVENEHLSVAIAKGAKDRMTVAVHFDPRGLPISVFRSTIMLQPLNGNKKLPREIPLAIIARIVGPIKATPSSIYLGSVMAGEVVNRSITVSSADLDLRDLIIEKQPDGGTAWIDGVERGMARINVQLSPITNRAEFHKSLSLLHRGSEVRLRIPIFGLVNSTASTVTAQ